MSTALTQTTSGNDAGTKPVASWSSLPAATTTMTPAARAAATASCIAADVPAPPRLMLITSARCAGTVPEPFGSAAANRIACAMSKSEPPSLPRTRIGMMRAAQSTPATPVPLSVWAPIVPATCVPWNEETTPAA